MGPVGALFVLLLSGVFYAAGEYFSKLWGISHSWHLVLLGVLCSALSFFVWLPALLYRNQLSTIGIAWLIIAMCAELVLGLVVFHEQLSLAQWSGVVFGVIALWLLVV